VVGASVQPSLTSAIIMVCSRIQWFVLAFKIFWFIRLSQDLSISTRLFFSPNLGLSGIALLKRQFHHNKRHKTELYAKLKKDNTLKGGNTIYTEKSRTHIRFFEPRTYAPDGKLDDFVSRWFFTFNDRIDLVENAFVR
jgi:hypothetical protein